MNRPIPRRAALRGLGALVGLPWLEAMASPSIRGVARAARPNVDVPVRLLVLFVPNGVNPTTWTPAGEGRDWTPSRALEPLAPHRDDVLVLTNLWNRGSRGGDGHYVKVAGFLTGTTIAQTTGRHLDAGGVSMDQVAARAIGDRTPLPSLELSTEPVTGGIDRNVNYTRLYGSYVSWRTRTTPAPREIDPRLAFDRLFRTDGGLGARERSVLDLVREEARSLTRRLGADDRRKLDEYLDSVRGVERRIEHLDAHRSRPPAADVRRDVDAFDERLATTGDAFPDRVRAMLDLAVLAFRADRTRVASFMFGNAVTNRSYAFLDGVTGGHHEISHHQNAPDALEQYTRIARWQVEQLAHVIARMKAVDEGECSLLDHSMVLFGSALRDGNRHDPKNLPVVVAGRAAGRLRPGRHVVHPRESKLCALHLGLLRRLGVEAESFGDADEELAGLG